MERLFRVIRLNIIIITYNNANMELNDQILYSNLVANCSFSLTHKFCFQKKNKNQCFKFVVYYACFQPDPVMDDSAKIQQNTKGHKDKTPGATIKVPQANQTHCAKYQPEWAGSTGTHSHFILTLSQQAWSADQADIMLYL